MTSRRFTIFALSLLICVGCTSTPTSEPPLEHQLWREKGCFAHILVEWAHLEANALQGTVVAANQGSPLPGAHVYARSLNTGTVIEAVTDITGQFGFTVPAGSYEVAVCADGWNPWRGVVNISRGSRSSWLTLPVVLGV